jgi:glucose/arabinose dehydrogenase
MQRLFFQMFILIIFISCSNSDERSSVTPRVPQEEEVAVDILTDRNDVIWGFDFLPDERIIFTERSGKLLILDPDTRQSSDVTGLPSISTGGESGLLDLKLHPNFSENNLVYFCYTAAGKTLTLTRARLNGNNLENLQNIFTSNTAVNSSNHFGCRIEFENSSQLFLSLGDQTEPSKAQDANSDLGKIHHMNDDGTAREIWSLGHRNVQGLAIQPGTGELFSSEHGPTGGDELNVIEKGNNYGWPLVTHGTPAGELGQSAPGFIDPLTFWTPAIAPSGMTFYTGDAVPAWKDSLFIATLRGEHLRRLTMNGRTVVAQELLFENEGTRFRNVRQGRDGFLYYSTDDGKIAKILLKQ